MHTHTYICSRRFEELSLDYLANVVLGSEMVRKADNFLDLLSE
jgi:hypothetical protein